MTWLQQILASVLISVIILSRYRSSCFISPMSVSSSPNGLIFKHVAKQEVYLWNKLASVPVCFGAHAASAPNWDWVSLQPSGSVRMNRKQVRFHRQLLCDEALEGEMQKFASTPPRRCWQKARSQRSTDRDWLRLEKKTTESFCNRKQMNATARRGQRCSSANVRLWNQETTQ